jgi:hypothetical protein
MKRWLQDFYFKKSAYERPNENWVCGRACEGAPCLIGPDAGGNCRATSECQPLRKGDRWLCTRAPGQGGSCAEGPRPDGSCCRPIPKCTPRRSVRAWRGIAVLLAASLALICLLWMFGSDKGVAFASPGELSFAHASAQSKCSDCHIGADGKPIEWLSPGDRLAVHDNNMLCLKCHDIGVAALNAHSLPADQMQQLTREIKTRNAKNPTMHAGLALASLVSGHADAHTGEQLACATCHKEHLGQNHDLKKIANTQCQACHTVQFASFAKGHPAFTKFPFERRTRIVFDHDAHFKHHFTEAAAAKTAPKSCLDCHQAEAKGSVMTVKPFETTCAHCHGEQVRGKGAVNPGIAVISLPKFDDRTMTGAFAIGEWPEDADQPLSAFTRLLLSGDAETRAALDALGNADLSNLPKGETNKLKAAQQVAWGIKGLVYDLSTLGQDELTRRVSAALGHPLAAAEAEAVARLLSAETVRAVFQTSFPHLQAEVSAYRENKKIPATELVSSPPLAKKTGKAAAPEAWVSNGGWFSPDSSFTLFYRPSGHRDNFLHAWMDLTSGPAQSGNTNLAAVFNQVTNPKGAGLCVKCHSIDATPTLAVNWRPLESEPTRHAFNRFSHTAHLSLLDNQGCMNCHAMRSDDGKQTYLGAFENNQRDPHLFRSNFQTINRDTCAICHRANFASDDCLHCHNYHIGNFTAVLPDAAVSLRARHKSGK